jgi:hypothetical protein
MGGSSKPYSGRGRRRGSCQIIDNAERRQVTVMFSDLLGSIALSAGMDMAGAFAKASAQASSGPGALWCRFGSTAAKRAGRRSGATLKLLRKP